MMKTKLRRTKGKSPDDIGKKEEMFKGGKYQDAQLQREKENGKKKGVGKRKKIKVTERKQKQDWFFMQKVSPLGPLSE